MIKLSQKDLKEKSDYFYSYMGMKKNNASLSEVDPNANVNNKNIATLGAEYHKDINVQVNRYILGERIGKLFGEETKEEYYRQLSEYEVYSHDESTAGIKPYCVAIDLYPFINEGNIPVGGSSKAPKHLASFCGVYVNLIFLMASQFAGACLYKDQKIIIKKDGKTQAVPIKDFVESFTFDHSFNYDNSTYNVAPVSGVEVYEDGRFVEIKNAFKRDYRDTIYTIETASGKKVRTSKDHRFKVLYRGRDIEVRAEDLKVGDTVYNTYNKMDFNKNSYDYKLGQLLGIMAGDGNIEDAYTRVSINHSEGFITDFLNDFGPQFFGDNFVGTLSEGNKCYSYYVGASKVSSKLKEYINGMKFYDKNIDISNYSLETQLGFLDGLIATDGGYNNSISLTLSNEGLIKTVQEILDNINVHVSYKEIEVLGNRKPAWNITIPMKVCKFLSLGLKKCEKNNKFNNALKEDRGYLGDAFSTRGNRESRCSTFKRHGSQKIVEDVGTDYIKNITVSENDDEYVYEIETESHWYSAGNIITHNCADVSMLTYFDYFARKDYGDNYLITHKREIENHLQQLIYTLNDPSVGRGNQAVFYNTSIFDKYYFDSLFGKLVFPDFTSPNWESVNKLQQFFMKWFNQERTRAILTFPVITAAGLTNGDGTFKDKEFKHFITKEMSEGNSFFIYSSDTPDSLASCCRLRNEVKEVNPFAYTLGGTGIATGSKKVFTLNVNRMVQLGHDVREEIRKIHKYLVAFNEILYEELEHGMLPVYDAGYISLDKQYLTVGVNGVVEAAEFLGFEISDNEEYKTWLKELLKAIKEENALASEHYTKKATFSYNGKEYSIPLYRRTTATNTETGEEETITMEDIVNNPSLYEFDIKNLV